MAFDSERHHRRSLRLKGFDYSRAGAYFVTLCTKDRACLFGSIQDGVVHLTDLGKIVAETWNAQDVGDGRLTLDAWVVMPNHLHGVVILPGGTEGTTRTAPTSDRARSLGRWIGAFKTVSTRRMNEIRGTPEGTVWQRNFYEHVIRDEKSLQRIREYIAHNPARWELDRENPERIRKAAVLRGDST